MQQRQTIRDLKVNDDVRSVFLIGAASLQQSRNGPYWRLELRDATGSLEAKIWSPLSAEFSNLAPGQLVEVGGRVGLFREQPQVTVENLRPLTDAERDALNLADFMPASPGLRPKCWPKPKPCAGPSSLTSPGAPSPWPCWATKPSAPAC